ncbi:hypothetical protein [Actinoplanes sp. GCM10030250]|uniref:hypothetical protein n=1 Tax=Actinoplanes sp. GCM10030250 TaxID=3273376 RepID=UPI00360D6508
MPFMNEGRFVVSTLAVVCLLGGCSGAEDDKRAGSPSVASLQSPDTQASSPSAPDDQRPLLALDVTDEERDALWKVWGECIKKEGGPGYEEPKLVYLYEKQKDPKAQKVRAACLSKEPEKFEERQLRTDVSAFRDNQREFYKCAKEAGYQLTAPDEDGQFGLTEVGPLGDWGSDKMQDCRKAAFSQ